MRHRFVPTFFPGPAPRSPACVDPRVGTRGPRLARTVPSPPLPRVVGSAVLKLRPVTSGHAAERAGSSPPCVREPRPRRAASWVRLRRCAVGRAAAGAPGLLGAPPPAPRIPGPGGERGGRPARAAGCARAARSAESWGRSLARPPPRSQSLAFCAATLPDPRGPRRPRARPAQLPRESLRRPAGPGGALRAPPLGSGNSAARGVLAVASPKEGDTARVIGERPGPVSAPRPRAGGAPGVREETAVPGTLAARQRRAGSGGRSSL